MKISRTCKNSVTWVCFSPINLCQFNSQTQPEALRESEESVSSPTTSKRQNLGEGNALKEKMSGRGETTEMLCWRPGVLLQAFLPHLSFLPPPAGLVLMLGKNGLRVKLPLGPWCWRHCPTLSKDVVQGYFSSY